MVGKRWPLWIWSLQLLPALSLVAIAIYRHAWSGALQLDWRMTWFAFAVGAIWSLSAGAMLAFPRGRRWILVRRIEWGLSAGTLAVGLIAMDIALTLLGIVPTIEEQRSHSLAYAVGRFTKHRLIPQDVVLDAGGTIHINERGFRGPEISVEPDPDRVRIVFLGGSQVFDFSGGDWPAMVEEEFERLGQRVEVINAAVPGHSTFDSLGKVLTDLWTLKPDVLFVCHAWNDIKYFKWVAPNNPYRGLPPKEPRVWRRDWRNFPVGIDRVLSYSAVYRQFRWGFIEMLYYEEGGLTRWAEDAKPQPISTESWGLKHYRLNLTLIARMSEEIGAIPVLCKQARLATAAASEAVQAVARDYVEKYIKLPYSDLLRAFELTDGVIDDLARRHGLRVVDMDRDMSGRQAYFDDGIHFSPQGSHAAAALVARALREVVNEAKLARQAKRR